LDIEQKKTIDKIQSKKQIVSVKDTMNLNNNKVNIKLDKPAVKALSVFS